MSNPLKDALEQQQLQQNQSEATSTHYNHLEESNMTNINPQTAAEQIMAAMAAKAQQGGNVFTYQGMDHFDDEEVKYFGQIHTLEKVREMITMYAPTIAAQNETMAVLANNGSIQFIDKRSKLQRQMEKGFKKVDQSNHTENLKFQQTQEVARRVQDDREFGHVQSGTLDFDNEVQRNNFLRWAEPRQIEITELGVNAKGFPNITVVDVTEKQAKAISRYYRENKIGMTAQKAIRGTGKMLSKSVSFSFDSLITPVAKSAVAVSGTAVATTYKAVAEVGASVVNSTTYEAERVSYQMHNDVEVQEAKRTITNAWGKTRNLFGRASRTANGINLQ